MADLVFYLFSALAIASAFLLVVSRNPVNSAMFMILALVSMAVHFALLEAFFLAILQILVYAGAVVVLFLFIIMLLDVEEAKTKRWPVVTISASGVLFALGAVLLITIFGENVTKAPPIMEESAASVAKNFGYGLFTKYLLPFQVAGFLLLIAMVGVIHLSRKRQSEASA